MTIKSITTFLHHEDAATPALEMAIGLARRFDAHLTVLAPGVDRTDAGYYYAGAHALALRENFSEALHSSEALSALVSERLKGEVIPWDHDDRILQGPALGEYLTERVRYSDLVVLPQPYGEGRSYDDVVALESVLFGARVPALVVPDGAKCDGSIDRILLAWNESDEAMRAARAALPFVAKAEETDITIIDPPRHGAGRSDPGGSLACYLNRHGARSQISIIARSEPKISDTLIRRARESGADLIVMGAYGHTRMREAIIGGATRHMLEHSKVPMLMAH